MDALIMGEPRFSGKAKRLDAWDYGRVGKHLGLTEDMVRAVIEVEASGSGFDKKGRIKMLFEPHIFWRELAPGKRMLAENQKLAYRRWQPGNYPSDSYPRLQAAMRIDRPAALRSASWGLGQIMGFNCKEAGYQTAAEMVDAFADDEEKHVEAMINFIVSNSLDDDLRRLDWSGFARGYNGAGFAEHGYHTKLAAAYAKWRRVPDAKQP